MIQGCSCSCSYSSSHCHPNQNLSDKFRVFSSSKHPNLPPNPRAFVGFKKQERQLWTKRNLDPFPESLPAVPNKVRDIQKGTGYGLHLDPLLSTYKNPRKSCKTRRQGGSLSIILRSLNCDNDFEETLSSACQNLSPKEQSVILKQQKKWEKVVRAYEFFKSEADYSPNIIHCNIVIRALGRARRWDELGFLLNDLSKRGIMPTNDTYGTLVDVYGKAGLVKESLMWIKHMKQFGMFPDEVTMNSVLKVMKDAGEYEQGDRFYKGWCKGEVDLDAFNLESSTSFNGSFIMNLWMKKAPDRIPDTKKLNKKPYRTSTYNSLIDLYGKAGRVQDATDLFDEMLNCGVAMDTITYNTMIFAVGSNGNLAEAEALLAKMQDQGIQPDIKTYNIMLSLYAEFDNITAACGYYQKIREVGLCPDIVTYRAFLHVLCKRKMIQEAESVIEDIKRSSSCIDEHSIPGMVKMYVHEGLLTQATRLLTECKSSCRFSSKTRAAILDAYAEEGLWYDAERIFYNLEGKDVLEYNVMVKAYGMAKLYDKAYWLLKEMRIEGLNPDACTFNSLIQMFCGCDLVDRAMQLLVEMKQEGFVPNCVTFSSLIACFVRIGYLSDAEEVYKEMIEIGVKPNEVVFGALINGFAESGECKEALKYFEEMRLWRVPVNQIVLTSLVKVYGKLGFINKARMVYQMLTKIEGGPDVVASNSMMKFYAELGMVAEAERLFHDLKKKHSADSFSFATIMNLYQKMGMITEAINVAEDLKQNGSLKDVVLYNYIMSCYLTDGKLHECGELLQDMVLKNIIPDRKTLKILFSVMKKGNVPVEAVLQLESCCEEGKQGAEKAVFATVFYVAGMHDLALQFMEDLINASGFAETFIFNSAINIYGQCGRISSALNMFLRMQEEGIQPDIVSFIFLARCYGKAGMVEGVKRIYWQVKDGKIRTSDSLIEAIVESFKCANRRDLAHLVVQQIRCLKEGGMECEE